MIYALIRSYEVKRALWWLIPTHNRCCKECYQTRARLNDGVNIVSTYMILILCLSTCVSLAFHDGVSEKAYIFVDINSLTTGEIFMETLILVHSKWPIFSALNWCLRTVPFLLSLLHSLIKILQGSIVGYHALCYYS